MNEKGHKYKRRNTENDVTAGYLTINMKRKNIFVFYNEITKLPLPLQWYLAS